MWAQIIICRSLLKQEMRCAFSLALARAGNNIAARMAMMAMTTSNSINVKARRAARTGQGRLGVSGTELPGMSLCIMIRLWNADQTVISSGCRDGLAVLHAGLTEGHRVVRATDRRRALHIKCRPGGPRNIEYDVAARERDLRNLQERSVHQRQAGG